MKKKILSDHKQVRKKFIPPAKHLIGFTEIHYIERLLPEIAWVGFFLKTLGRVRGTRAALAFGKACWEKNPRGQFRGFPLLSSFQTLLTEDWERIADGLKTTGIFDDCCKALWPFIRGYPNSNPFGRFVELSADVSPDSSDIQVASAVVHDLFDRRSQEASLVQAVVHALRLETGTLKYSSRIPIPNL